jgi:hypothetical protein
MALCDTELAAGMKQRGDRLVIGYGPRHVGHGMWATACGPRHMGHMHCHQAWAWCVDPLHVGGCDSAIPVEEDSG